MSTWERAPESRKIGRLPALQRTPRRNPSERSPRLNWDEALGESPITAGGLGSLSMPLGVMPSPTSRSFVDMDVRETEDVQVDQRTSAEDHGHGEQDDGADHEDEHIEPSGDMRDDASVEADDAIPRAHNLTEQDDHEISASQNARIASKMPQSQRPGLPPSSHAPRNVHMDYYETIDFDKITDPFTDTRRAFMRGMAAAPSEPPKSVHRAPSSPPKRTSIHMQSESRRSPSPTRSLQANSPSLQARTKRASNTATSMAHEKEIAFASPRLTRRSDDVEDRAMSATHKTIIPRASVLSHEAGFNNAPNEIPKEPRASISSSSMPLRRRQLASGVSMADTRPSNVNDEQTSEEKNASSSSASRFDVAESHATVINTSMRATSKDVPRSSSTHTSRFFPTASNAIPATYSGTNASSDLMTDPGPSSQVPRTPRTLPSRRSSTKSWLPNVDNLPGSRQPVSATPSAGVSSMAHQPTRSNRLLTEELLKWKKKYADLEDEMDALQYKLEHMRDDAAVGSASEQDMLVQKIEELQRGRENDRKAMRQRVRVLESHMADTKTEYDNRYWRLLISSPDVSSDASSVHVQLVVQQNQVTRLEAELAEQKRQARLAREHSAFLVGLYKWRGSQLLQSQSNGTGQLSLHIAHLEQQLEKERSARIAAERALHARSFSGSSALAGGWDVLHGESSRLPANDQNGLDLPSKAPLASQTFLDRESSPIPTLPPSLSMQEPPISPTRAVAEPEPEPEPVQRDHEKTRGSLTPVHAGRADSFEDPDSAHALTNAADAATGMQETTEATEAMPLKPGMTPMLRRTAVLSTDLEIEGTPMLGLRTKHREEGEASPVIRKKKRKLLGTGSSLFQLNEATASAFSPGLDVPTDLSPLPLP